MRTNKPMIRVSLVLMAAVMMLTSGCNRLITGVLTMPTAMFGAGYWLGASSNTTEAITECFLNGEAIDCTNMP